MATITINTSDSNELIGRTKLFWETLTTGDQGSAFEMAGTLGIFGSVQATGTFANGTVMTLQVSNDNTNWATLKDLTGTAIELSAAGLVDFTTAARYIRPSVASGSSDDVDVTVVLRR